MDRLAKPPTESHNRRRRGQFRNWIIMVDLGLRIIAAPAVFALVCYWIDVVIGIVRSQTLPDQTKLSDPVLITLLATTTANVVGLLYAVVANLFPNSSPGAKRTKRAEPSGRKSPRRHPPA